MWNGKRGGIVAPKDSSLSRFSHFSQLTKHSSQSKYLMVRSGGQFARRSTNKSCCNSVQLFEETCHRCQVSVGGVVGVSNIVSGNFLALIARAGDDHHRGLAAACNIGRGYW
jgi:hypothetical protein